MRGNVSDLPVAAPPIRRSPTREPGQRPGESVEPFGKSQTLLRIAAAKPLNFIALMNSRQTFKLTRCLLLILAAEFFTTQQLDLVVQLRGLML
jgi:hypothetical protein